MEALLAKAISGMEKGGFEVVRADTAQAAAEYLLAHIAPEQTVGAGGSVSVQQTGVLPMLEAKGCTVHTHWRASGAEAEAIMRKARDANVYLCSVNAVSRDGELVMVDGRGNRLGAVCDGPEQVYFIVSENKVVDGGLMAAMARVKRDAAPPNCRRLGLNTPCAHTGKCAGEECMDPSCRITLVLDCVPRRRKMTVILVKEKLGY